MTRILAALAVLSTLVSPAFATDTLPPAGDPEEVKVRTLVA